MNEMIRYSPPRQGPIVVKVPTPRAIAKPKQRRGGRRGHRSASASHELLISIGTGWAMGYIDKQGTSIPTIPVLGRAGSLALAAHFFLKSPTGKCIRDSLATIAAYEMGNTGSISGDDDPNIDDLIAPQS